MTKEELANKCAERSRMRSDYPYNEHSVKYGFIKGYESAEQRIAELEEKLKRQIMDNKKEYIVCAAILRKEVKQDYPDYVMSSMEIGFRHHDIYRRFNTEEEVVRKNPKSQGFMTSKGRFVGREEAAEMAFSCGQIEEKRSTLFSEDIY